MGSQESDPTEPSTWPETNRLPGISPAKMGLLGLKLRTSKFGVYNHNHPRARPHKAKEGESFYREGTEVGRALVNKQPMAFHCLSPSQERRGDFLLPGGLYYGHRTQQFQLHLIEISVYLFIYIYTSPKSHIPGNNPSFSGRHTVSSHRIWEVLWEPFKSHELPLQSLRKHRSPGPNMPPMSIMVLASHRTCSQTFPISFLLLCLSPSL